MSNQAQALHNESIIIDGLFFQIYTPVPHGAGEPPSDLLLDHIQASGVTAFNHSVIIDSFPVSIEQALWNLYQDSAIFETFPDRVLQVRSVADIKRAKDEGKVGIIFGTQGLACVGIHLHYIWVLYNLGVRIMQITYNERNALGSGCMEPTDHGLTRFGQQVIDEMGRLGIVLDLSHCGHRTSLDAIARSTNPMLFTHVGVKALCDHPRNVTDEQIKAVAEAGGVIGLCPHSIMVEKRRGEHPSVHDFIDHIDYVVQLVGIDHVGIGTDNFQYDTFYSRLRRSVFERAFPTFFGGYGMDQKHVEGFRRWSDWPNLTACLLERGYSPEDVKKILGGNFLRVFAEVWRSA